MSRVYKARHASMYLLYAALRVEWSSTAWFWRPFFRARSCSLQGCRTCAELCRKTSKIRRGNVYSCNSSWSCCFLVHIIQLMFLLLAASPQTSLVSVRSSLPCAFQHRLNLSICRCLGQRAQPRATCRHQKQRNSSPRPCKPSNPSSRNNNQSILYFHLRWHR